MSSTSVYHAFDYLIGLGVFGFVYALINLFLPTFADLSSTGAIKDYANYMWAGALVIYLVFGPFYFWNRLKEWGGQR